MNCPVCVSERLVISERSGIEIDYCPKCRGVWLDRGELDKIIERAEKNYAPRHEYKESSPYNREKPKENYNYNDGHHHNHKHHKKESFWSDLFD